MTLRQPMPGSTTPTPPRPDAPRSSSAGQWARAFAASGAAAAVLALAAGCGGGAGDDGAGDGGASTSATAGTVLQQTSASGAGATPKTDPVLASINAARAVARPCGATTFAAVAPVSAHATLEQAATEHSAWMQANDTMSHVGEGGSTAATRLDALGFRWSAVGENVAMGYDTAQQTIAAWLASPGHCANIMSADFSVVGFATTTRAGSLAPYATLVLARAR